MQQQRDEPSTTRRRGTARPSRHQSATSKKPCQPELGELGLVRVEHEAPAG
jgi:hypothetical protein